MGGAATRWHDTHDPKAHTTMTLPTQHGASTYAARAARHLSCARSVASPQAWSARPTSNLQRDGTRGASEPGAFTPRRSNNRRSRGPPRRRTARRSRRRRSARGRRGRRGLARAPATVRRDELHAMYVRGASIRRRRRPLLGWDDDDVAHSQEVERERGAASHGSRRNRVTAAARSTRPRFLAHTRTRSAAIASDAALRSTSTKRTCRDGVAARHDLAA